MSYMCYSVSCAGRFVTMLASVLLTVIFFFFFLTKLFQLEKKTLKINDELLHREHRLMIKRGRNLFQSARKSLRRRHHKRKLILVLAFQGRLQMSPDRRVWVKCHLQGDVFWNIMVQNYSDTNWVKHFRMSRDTFISLAN